MISPESLLWSTLQVAGRKSPGTVVVTGDGIPTKWDVKDGDGLDGATSDLKSKPIRKFKATFQLSNEEDGDGWSDFDRWDDFQALLESTHTQPPTALELYYPSLAAVHITAASVENIGLVTVAPNGMGTVSVDFIECRPPKPRKVGSAKQVKTEGDKKIDEAKAELKALLDAGKEAPVVVGDAL